MFHLALVDYFEIDWTSYIFVVSFQGNPLNCDCYTRPLYNYLRTQSALPEQYENIRCAEPAVSSGMPLYNVSDELLTCVPAPQQEIYQLLPDIRFREVT